MDRKLVLIAGGSGSGKSTIAKLLKERYPSDIAVVHLDDYFKPSADAPKLANGMTNWDTPDAIEFDRLRKDISALLEGQAIDIKTRSEIYNPGFIEGMEERLARIEPARVIVLEGFLALCDATLRDMAAYSVYLSMPLEESLMRRSSNKFMPSADYIEQVLKPMHREYVEKNAQYADLIVPVHGMNPEQVLTAVCEGLREKGILD